MPQFEIVNRYAPERSINALLYTPVKSALRCRETRLYELDTEGPEERVAAFVRKVLADPVSDTVHAGEAPALGDWCYIVDVWMKPGVLDLEKNMILQFFHELPDPGFSLRRLRLVRRLYLGGAEEDVPPERVIRDVVNPAIQTQRVIHA
jgi:hypothetical protein